jgi:putative membrane protein
MITSKKIPLNYIINATYKDLLILIVFTSLSFIIHLYTNFFTIPIAISAFLGTAISLILSFNLSQSYDRWWEARKIWGEIVNDSRALTLQLKRFTKKEDKERYKEIVKLQIAWNYALVSMLRKNENYSESLKYIDEDIQDSFILASHKPLWIYNIIQEKLKLFTSLNSYEQIHIDSTLSRLIAYMGKSERIKNTIFPREYQMLLHLSIYFFLGFLSISLANLGHNWEIFLLILISVPFFLLESTARHLQNPFENIPSDVPIYSISRNIEINLLTLIEEKNIPSPIKDNGFFIN